MAAHDSKNHIDLLVSVASAVPTIVEVHQHWRVRRWRSTNTSGMRGGMSSPPGRRNEDS